MKKIHSFYLLMLCTLLASVKAQTIQVPVEGTQYQIVHSANYVLSGAHSNARIENPNGIEDQNFEFVPVAGKAGVYVILNSGNGKYLGLDSYNGYSTQWREDPEDELCQFAIEPIGEVFIKFSNVLTGRTGSYLGTDSNSPGSSVYTDKSGNSRTHHWKIRVAQSDLAREFLQETIDSALVLINTATPGSNVGEYPAEAMAALQEAIVAAQNTLSGTLEEWVASRSLLNAAITVFYSEKIAFVINPQALYYIRHSGGMFLGKGSPNVCLTIPSGAETQKFRLFAVTDERNVYNLQLVDTDEFLSKEGSYNLTWTTSGTENSAQFKIELASDGDLVFKCLNNNAYIGTDNSTPSSGVYSNKGSGAENSHWTLLEVDPTAVLTDYLELLIATAEHLIENSPVGDKGHQWPQAAVDALNASLAEALEVLNNPQSQDAVNLAADALDQAIEIFKAAEITPMLEPHDGDQYRYSVSKYSSKYMSSNGENVRTTAERMVAEPSQLWEMIPVEGSPGQFIMKQGNLAFDADDSFSVSPYDPASSTAITLRFIRTANGIDYYGLLRADGKVLTFGSGTTAAWQDFQTTNDAHWGIFTKADLPHDPNKSSLIAYLPTAKNQLASKNYGTESGLWSIHSRDSLTFVLNKAQAIAEGSGNTQEAVDEMLEELRGTVAWHETQIITVILDDLLLAIAEAEEVVEAAVIGTRPGEYYPSDINEFINGPLAEARDALKLSVQEEVDAAAEKMRTDTEEFKSKAHATDVDVERVLQEAIAAAEELYASIVPGIDKGEYPATALEEFGLAIAQAKESPATQETLDALLAARVRFESSVLTVDRSLLAAAIQSARTTLDNSEAGDCDGQFPQIALDEYEVAIGIAEQIYPDLTASQEAIDAALSALREAGVVLNTQKIVIDFNALREAINQATQTMNNAVPEKGEGPGTYPESAFTALEQAIGIAQVINGSKTVNQEAVNEAVVVLSEAENSFKETRVPNDYSELVAKIAAANNWLDHTTVGTEAGQVSASAVASLRASVADAETFLSSTVQTEINTAVARLNKDIELFKAQIVEANVTLLAKKVADSKAAIEKYNIREGDLYDRLMELVAEAEPIVEEPIVTQTIVDELEAELRRALDAYIGATGLATIEGDEIEIYTAENELYIHGLPAHSELKVFTVSGVLVHRYTAEGNFRLRLNPGVYVLQIQVNYEVKTVRISIR